MEKQVLDKFRKEIKFQFPIYDLDKIHNECLENGFIQEYPNRNIESIYFDTIYNSSLEDSVNGILEREKVRLRRYDVSDSGQLERKIKNNQLNKKLVTQLANVPDFSNYKQLATFILKHCPNEILLPTSYVSYSRTYLINKKSNVRITLDFGINTHDFQSNIYKEINDSFILEVKSDIDSEFPKLNLGVHTRFSKYSFSRLHE